MSGSGATVPVVDGHALSIAGRVFRVAKLRDEPYDLVRDPQRFLAALRAGTPGVDLVTFAQDVNEPEPRFAYHVEYDQIAALPITTYKHWYGEVIGFKARNKTRKAGKAGVDVRTCTLDDRLVGGIREIYNESPLIQGRRNWHYGKTFEQMQAMLSTYLDRSVFIGAFLGEELIGFVKLTDLADGASLMHIIAKHAHRDKAPTNALIAKSVEVCASRGLKHLYYALWSRRGLGVFKMNHGFVPVAVPRYYVPLTWRGQLLLSTNMHRGLRARLPEHWVDKAVEARNRLNALRFGPPEQPREDRQMRSA